MKKLIGTLSIILMSGLLNPVLPCKTGGEGSTSCSYTSTTYFMGIPVAKTSNSITCGEGQYACCTENGAGCEYEEPTIVQGEEDDGWF